MGVRESRKRGGKGFTWQAEGVREKKREKEKDEVREGEGEGR